MMDVMHQTYDPERMAQMPKYSNYGEFREEEYFNTARQLVQGKEEDYPPHLIEGVLQQLRQLNPEEFRLFVDEQW
jgi:hypothetical protein